MRAGHSNRRWHRVPTSCVAALVAAVVAGAPGVDAKDVGDGFGAEAVSTRADYVSGGNVLVRIAYKHANRNHPLGITLNGRDVSASFHPGDEPNTLLGLVTGLAPGKNELRVQGNGSSGIKDQTLMLTNYPITGPIISGAHDYAFFCQTQQFRMPDGSTMMTPVRISCTQFGSPTCVQPALITVSRSAPINVPATEP